MTELKAEVPQTKTVVECQRCSRLTDNPERLCDICLEQKKYAPKGGNIEYPEPTDFTSQNF